MQGDEALIHQSQQRPADNESVLARLEELSNI